jgi:hypothetical protein
MFFDSLLGIARTIVGGAMAYVVLVSILRVSGKTHFGEDECL